MLIEEFLVELRRQRFRPAAIATYVRQVAARIREDFDAAPGAVRSLWAVALGFFAAAFVGAAALALLDDRHLAYDFFLYTSLCTLVTFVLVSFHVGMLRDEDGYRLSAVNVPTALTLLRVVLMPGITLLLLERRFALAFAMFLLASLTDIADGWVARRWNQATQLGKVLDPLVDIVFNLSLFAALCLAHLLPTWVFLVAAVRYGILLVGAAYLYLFVGPVRVHSTLFGRLTGLVMAALVGLLTLLESVNGALAERLAPLTEVALGVLLSATVLQVVVLGWFNLRIMRGAVRAQGRVVDDVRWGSR